MKRCGKTGKLRRSDGVVLIALLWILTALAIIALSFSRETFVEVAAARNAQSLESGYFIARSGLALTTYQLLQRKIYPVTVQRAELQSVPDPIDAGVVTGAFAGGEYRVDIQDESGKINVNFVLEAQLRALVEASGISKPDSDVITDSIMDWKDTNTNVGPNGAEDDYYQNLTPAYRAKNGRIDAVEELLLIRGMTADYFYGHPERAPDGSVFYKYGLSRYLTVYSTRNQVNVNYAALPVLLSIPGMQPSTAQGIYARRRTKPFKSMQELLREIPEPLGPQSLSLLTTDQTGVYTLTVSAHAASSKAKRVIRTVISLMPGQGTQYQTLYWNENIPDYEGTAP